jgi:hypothetical protein
MFTFQDVAKVFPPAPTLEKVLTWWMGQPDGDVALTRAAATFFGGLSNVPLEAEEERAVDMLRFMEWYLLDETLEAGDTVVGRYASLAPESEKAALEDLQASRHDRWVVKFVEMPKLTVAPLGGGASITVTSPDLARDAAVGEQIVGRFYRWEDTWLPSVTLFFLPAEEQPETASGPLGALEAQQKFFMVDPEEAQAFNELVERFFKVVAAQDESEFLSLVEPEGEVALVYDVWGWPGVRLISDWGAEAADVRVLSMGPDMGAMRTEVAWRDPARGDRGATLWWFQAGAGGWRVVEAMPELEDGPVNPDFAQAQDKGATPAYRAEAPDAVEEKLRKSMAARKLAMLDQGTMIKAWRMTSPKAMRDPSAPEAWAAAVEAFFYESAQMQYSMNQVADTYGAKKSLVKERFEVLSEAFNQLAGQR